MKTWLDITNTPQVHFLLGIRNILQQIGYHEFIFTAREFSETSKLLAQYSELPFATIGGYHGKSKFKKAIGLAGRFWEVQQLQFRYDLSISCGSESAIWSAWIKRKKSIAFGDNDIAQQWTYAPFVNYAFFPSAIPANVLNRQGLRGKIYQYDGYKEDIYISYYQPDMSFKNKIPFENYVLVRPENLQARYMGNRQTRSIVPELIKKLISLEYNVLYLPRYEIDRNYVEKKSRIFIPENPLNGLDACYFADAVLTGAGTLAREAACLGVPAFSFYAGKKLLAVDQQMIRDGWVVYSRHPSELVNALKKSSIRQINTNRSVAVQFEVKEKLKEVLELFR